MFFLWLLFYFFLPLRNSKEIGRNKEVLWTVKESIQENLFDLSFSIDVYFIIDRFQRAIYRQYTIKYNLNKTKKNVFLKRQ